MPQAERKLAVFVSWELMNDGLQGRFLSSDDPTRCWAVEVVMDRSSPDSKKFRPWNEIFPEIVNVAKRISADELYAAVHWRCLPTDDIFQKESSLDGPGSVDAIESAALLPQFFAHASTYQLREHLPNYATVIVLGFRHIDIEDGHVYRAVRTLVQQLDEPAHWEELFRAFVVESSEDLHSRLHAVQLNFGSEVDALRDLNAQLHGVQHDFGNEIGAIRFEIADANVSSSDGSGAVSTSVPCTRLPTTLRGLYAIEKRIAMELGEEGAELFRRVSGMLNSQPADCHPIEWIDRIRRDVTQDLDRLRQLTNSRRSAEPR